MKKGKWRLVLVAVSLMALIGSGAGCATVVAPDEEVPTSAFLTYTDQANGFSIDYPSGWEQMPEEFIAEGVTVAFWPQKSEDVELFTVGTAELPSEMSLRSFFTEARTHLETVEGCTSISTEDTVIGGIPAIEYTYTSEEDGVTFKAMQVFLMRGKSVWSITCICVSESFSSLEPTFDAIVDSFRLLGTAAPTSAFLTYTDQANGFSIDYPSGWERMPGWLLGGAEMLLGGGGNIAAGFGAPAKEEHGFTPNFSIARITLPYEQGLQAGYEDLKLTVEQEDGYIFISKDDLTVDGIPAIKYVYRSSYIADSTTMYVYLVQGTIAWLITFSCAPQSFDSLEPTFDAIANSFQRL